MGRAGVSRPATRGCRRCCDSRTNSGLRKIRRKVSLDFAKFDWTRRHQLSRPGEDREDCPTLAGGTQSRSGRSQCKSSRLTLQFRRTEASGRGRTASARLYRAFGAPAHRDQGYRQSTSARPPSWPSSCSADGTGAQLRCPSETRGAAMSEQPYNFFGEIFHDV